MSFRIVEVHHERKPRPEVIAACVDLAENLAATEAALGRLPRVDLIAPWVSRAVRERLLERQLHEQKEASP